MRTHMSTTGREKTALVQERENKNLASILQFTHSHVPTQRASRIITSLGRSVRRCDVYYCRFQQSIFCSVVGLLEQFPLRNEYMHAL